MRWGNWPLHPTEDSVRIVVITGVDRKTMLDHLIINLDPDAKTSLQAQIREFGGRSYSGACDSAG